MIRVFGCNRAAPLADWQEGGWMRPVHDVETLDEVRMIVAQGRADRSAPVVSEQHVAFRSACNVTNRVRGAHNHLPDDVFNKDHSKKFCSHFLDICSRMASYT